METVSWWTISGEECLRLLQSSPQGLSPAEARRRGELCRNELRERSAVSPLILFLRQFTDTMVLVLLGATVISGLIGAMADAVTIMIIVLLNAILGFIQEYSAEQSLAEIRKLSAPTALVIRGGQRRRVPTEELTPGDIVLLENGEKVPADVRLLQTYALAVDEAALTGESLPAEKDAALAGEDKTPLAERGNMAYMGTAVVRGRGVSVVTAVGEDTVMGQIAAGVSAEREAMTPLQQRLDQLGKILIVICIAVCALVAGLGYVRGEPLLTMLMAGISLAVAAIPEGLPAIVTVALAIGVKRMAGKNAIVRQLPAVETLGCTTVICSDKTGTLTCNRMAVQRIFAGGQEYDAATALNPAHNPPLQRLLDIAVGCNNAEWYAPRGQERRVEGEPTEAALLLMADQAGWRYAGQRLQEFPFDSQRKRMSVVAEWDGQPYLLVKGAADSLLELCTHYEAAAGPGAGAAGMVSIARAPALDQTARRQILDTQRRWAGEALRVLGFAWRRLEPGSWEKSDELALEQELTFAGLCGMIDPPRPGVAESVRACKQAGIVPVMITGDHPLTAAAIARATGISELKTAVTGAEIDDLSDRQLYAQAMEKRVFARVSPEHKRRIVKVLQQRRQVVAMTGDGVNDAPAVKLADIGIAMGQSGAQVTREAASMVLADDNFNTIVRAVYEGRAIYDNIRKFIRYLLGGNIGEVLLMFLASLFNLPLPLLAIQILWVNLVTDGLPAMALGLEPPEPGIMRRAPRPRDENIFARRLGAAICGRGIYIALVSLSAFVIGLFWGGLDAEHELARTLAFTTLVFAQLFYVFECRYEHGGPLENGFFQNRFLNGAVLLSVLAQAAVIYLPGLQAIFHTVALDALHWALVLFLAALSLLGRRASAWLRR